MIWFNDYGHGGDDSGCIGYDGKSLEKNLNKIVGDRVTYHLIRHGQTVIEPREGDTNPSLSERVDKIKRSGCDIGLSIHCNAFNGQASGTEIWTWGTGKREIQLAEKVLGQLKKDNLIRINRGIKHEQWAILSAPIPSILIELEFIDTKEGLKHITDNVENLAISIVKGLLAFYDMPYKAEQHITPVTQNNKMYYVQVGAYGVKANAETRVRELKNMGISAIIKEG